MLARALKDPKAGFSLIEVLMATILLGFGFMCILAIFTIAMNATGRMVGDSLEQILGQSVRGEIRTLRDQGYELPDFDAGPIYGEVVQVVDKHTLLIKRNKPNSSVQPISANQLGNGGASDELDARNRILLMLSGAAAGRIYEITSNTGESGQGTLKLTCADPAANTNFILDRIDAGDDVLITGWSGSSWQAPGGQLYLKVWPPDLFETGSKPVDMGDYSYAFIVSGRISDNEVLGTLPRVHRVDVLVWTTKNYKVTVRPERNRLPAHHFSFYVMEQTVE